MAYLFTAGSCAKKDFYDTIIAAMINAGWSNITSNYATDGDVMYSTGINGDKTLYLNLLPYDGLLYGCTAAANTAYSSRTTTYWCMSGRLHKGYTPGSSGTAGVYPYAKPWRPFFMGLPQTSFNSSGANVPVDAVVNYYIYVDRNKVIVFSKLADNYTVGWMMNYWGLPDTQFAKCDGGRGAVLVASCCSAHTYINNYIHACDYPDESGGVNTNAAYYGLDPLTIQPSTASPNQNGKFFLTEVYGHNASYGMVNKLDGILATIKGGVSSGDTITVDGITYLLLNCHKGTDSYFFYNAYYYGIVYPLGLHIFAIRIS